MCQESRLHTTWCSSTPCGILFVSKKIFAQKCLSYFTVDKTLNNLDVKH